MDCFRGRGSGCSRPGHGISPLEEVTISPNTEPPELTQDWGNRLLESTNKMLCAPVTPQETDPDLPVNVQKSLAEVWVGGGLLQGWKHCMQQCVHGTF